jgi:hypothetical protein
VGLHLRLDLFRGVEAEHVNGALVSFYARFGCALTEEAPASRHAWRLHQRRGDWTALLWDGGWEWEERRQMQLFVSERLRCMGLLVFVYDGILWGYELFKDGEVLDRFVQQPEEAPFAADESWKGHPATLALALDLPLKVVAPHVQQGKYAFKREKFLEFLRLVGAGVELVNGRIQPLSPLSRAFRISRPGV